MDKIELMTIEELASLDRKDTNAFLNSMDRADMEKQIRKLISDFKSTRKITLTPEQFESHFIISTNLSKRGPKFEKRPEQLYEEQTELLKEKK